MFQKLFFIGAGAGVAAGLIAAVLHISLVIPIILEAELYESGALVHFGGDAGTAGTVPTEAAEVSQLSRNALTLLTMVATYAGYGLILVAGFALADRRGYVPNGRAGILWGLGGFVAVQIAPAMGLPPDLPGAGAADLFVRQLWWTGTVVFTALGLWIIAFARHWVPWTLAVILLVVPHLIGAPEPDAFKGVVPPELATLFVGRSIGIGLVTWVTLGTIAGYLWNRDSTHRQTL